jgi:hypothetical protein
MAARFALIVLLCVQAALSHILSRQPALGFFDPSNGGGSWLDNAGNGLGEPLNVIHSPSSCPPLRVTTVY